MLDLKTSKVEEPECERVRESDNDNEGDDVGLWRSGHRGDCWIFTGTFPNQLQTTRSVSRGADDGRMMFSSLLFTSNLTVLDLVSYRLRVGPRAASQVANRPPKEGTSSGVLRTVSS